MKKIMAIGVAVSCILFLLSGCFGEDEAKTSSREEIKRETEGLFYELDDQRYIVTGYGGEDKKVYIPDTKEGIKVEKIDFEAFENSEIEKVVLGKNITWIDLYAFKDCKNLKKINLPNKLDTIRGWAFSGCTSIKEIVIPESCWFIGYQAFAGWDSSQKIIIEGSADNFEEGWDEYCSAEIIFKK